MLGSTSVFALVLAGGLLLSPNTASAGAFDDLCGTTITTDTVIDGVTDVVGSNCVINVADRVNFSIIDSDIQISGGKDLEIYGEGRAQPPKAAQLLISGTLLDVTGDLNIEFEEGNIHIVNGNDITVSSIMTVEAEGGDIVIKDNPLTINVGTLKIDASGKSNVSIKNNQITADGDIDIDTYMGNISVKDNSIIETDSDSVSLATQGGDISVKGNDFQLAPNNGTHLKAKAGGGGKVTFKDNTGAMRGNLEISTIDSGDAGDIAVFDNAIDVDENGAVTITSEGGDITVRRNDFTPANGGTTVDAMGGDCVVDMNLPVLTCI
jgi:hypothetical protein